MVLRNARVHPLVDDGGTQRKRVGPVSYHHSVPAILQLPHSILEESGESNSGSQAKHVYDLGC